jgi:hypothetical protein
MRSKRIITKNRDEPQSVAAAEATLKELQAQLERHTGRATELEAARKQVSARMPCMMPSSVKSVD